MPSSPARQRLGVRCEAPLSHARNRPPKLSHSAFPDRQLSATAFFFFICKYLQISATPSCFLLWQNTFRRFRVSNLIGNSPPSFPWISNPWQGIPPIGNFVPVPAEPYAQAPLRCSADFQLGNPPARRTRPLNRPNLPFILMLGSRNFKPHRPLLLLEPASMLKFNIHAWSMPRGVGQPWSNPKKYGQRKSSCPPGTCRKIHQSRSKNLPVAPFLVNTRSTRPFRPFSPFDSRKSINSTNLEVRRPLFTENLKLKTILPNRHAEICLL